MKLNEFADLDLKQHGNHFFFEKKLLKKYLETYYKNLGENGDLSVSRSGNPELYSKMSINVESPFLRLCIDFG